MKLHEFQAKAILRREGIPLPESFLASNPQQAKQAATEIGYPVILKAQSLISGRGKAGGIRLARNDDETETAASDILSINLKGISIQNVLVEKAMKVENELFIGIHYDYVSREPTLVLVSEGGLSLEGRLPMPEKKTIRHTINPLLGLQAYSVRQACAKLGMDPSRWKVIEQIALTLWHIFTNYDALLAEINSLIINDDGRAFALDAKLIIDQNALFRQREFAGLIDPAMISFAQSEARKFGHQLIRMNGKVAVLVGGQGMASASVDALMDQSLKPAMVVILDTNATISSIQAACRLIEDDPNVKAVLVNIFCNTMRCDEIAQALHNVQVGSKKQLPYAIRVNGEGLVKAIDLLSGFENLNFSPNLEQAVEILSEKLETHYEHTH